MGLCLWGDGWVRVWAREDKILSLMRSYDGIMSNFTFEVTTNILNQSIEIGQLLGLIDGAYLRKPKTELRRKHKVRAIYSSLAIEGNTLSEDQITAIFNNERVVGPAKDILEVQNAIKVYDNLKSFDCFSERSYLSAHKMLMNGLIENEGKYRTKGVGIFKGNEVAHMAPPAWNVDNLMKELFEYLKKDDKNLIIRSCVFHYEMEFVHPFMDGNGRMGRLWQTIILMRYNPVFEFLPIEVEVKNSQEDYYRVLSESDKARKSTPFVEYMLEKIQNSLVNLVESQRSNFSDLERLKYFIENYDRGEFVRKDYLMMFKSISTATATRDLKKGAEKGLFEREGSDRITKYKIHNK